MRLELTDVGIAINDQDECLAFVCRLLLVRLALLGCDPRVPKWREDSVRSTG
jgi:hypothetical protein